PAPVPQLLTVAVCHLRCRPRLWSPDAATPQDDAGRGDGTAPGGYPGGNAVAPTPASGGAEGLSRLAAWGRAPGCARRGSNSRLSDKRADALQRSYGRADTGVILPSRGPQPFRRLRPRPARGDGAGAGHRRQVSGTRHSPKSAGRPKLVEPFEPA